MENQKIWRCVRLSDFKFIYHYKVWDTLRQEKLDCNIDPKSIETQLNTTTDKFKKKLKDRGERLGGGEKTFQFRFEDNPDYIEEWYYPFSMAKIPNERDPGVKDLSSMEKVLKKI